MASTATTYDTDCVLMLHMDGSNGGTTFTDSSTQANSMSRVADATTSTTTPKFGTASMLNSNGWIEAADNANYALGSGNFTIDFWFRMSTVGNTYLFDMGIEKLAVRYSGGLMDFYTEGGINGNEITFTPTANTWYHMAIVRTGTTLLWFKDGVSQTVSTATNSVNCTSHAYIDIGAPEQTSTQTLIGNIDEFRIVKGTAVWTSNFTPPIAAYTPPANSGPRFFMVF